MKRRLILLLSIVLLLHGLVSNSYAISDRNLPKNVIYHSLFEADISYLCSLIQEKKISCVELTRYYLQRISTYDSQFRCFITLCNDALEIAEQRDQALADGSAKGRLFGIPMVIKDNIDYAGYRTTNGLWPYSQPKAYTSAAVVEALLNEGAVIIGKTNMATEAQEARFSASDAIGETFNAYDPALAAGGSSGGSAVAVSLNFASAGLGTDTNASLRYPAVLNGCVSLRTTVGLLDREGCTILNGSRDTPGAITRSVADQARVLDVISGGSYYPNLNAQALKGARIGILQELSCPTNLSSDRTSEYIDKEVQQAFDNTVRELRACGALVFHVSIPQIFDLSSEIDYGSPSKQKLMDIYTQLFEDRQLDAVIFPTYLHTPQDSLTRSGWKNIYNTPFLSNCDELSSPLGIPEIAIPIGYHSKGAGIGLEIAALPYQEQELLNLAYSYTCVYPHRSVPGTAPNLFEPYYEHKIPK